MIIGSSGGIAAGRRCAALLVAVLAALALAPGSAVAAGSTRYVAEGGEDTGNDCLAEAAPCQTIRHAVAQADPGDLVAVAAGTYEEPQVVIEKELTLQGAGAGATIVSGSSASGLPSNGLLRFHPAGAADLSVRGFTLEGANAKAAVAEPAPILVAINGAPAGSRVTIAEDELLANEDLDPEVAADFSVGLFDYGSEASLEVEDNLFSGMWQGVLVEHSTGAATISGNEFSGLVSTTAGTVVYPAEGVLLLADGTSGHPGDVVTEPQLVSGNAFHDYTGMGVDFRAGYHEIATTTPSSFSDVAITGNRVDLGGSTFPPTGEPFPGIALETDRVDSAIEGASVEGNAVSLSAPGADIGVRGDVIGTEAHANRLVGSAIGLNAASATAPVDATDNWWACNAGPTEAGSNACATIAGGVTADPWLLLSAQSSAASISLGGATPITAAIDTDSDGATVAPAPDGTPVSFATDLGSLSQSSAQLQGGLAMSTLSGSAPGLAQVTATVDSESVPVQVEVLAPPPHQETPPSPPPPSEPPKVEEQRKPVVVRSAQPTVGTVSCGSSACHLAGSGTVKIGGKKVKLKVKLPASIAAGGSAPVKVVLPKSVRRALAKGKTGTVIVKVKVTDAGGQTVVQTIKVKIKPKKGKK